MEQSWQMVNFQGREFWIYHPVISRQIDNGELERLVATLHITKHDHYQLLRSEALPNWMDSIIEAAETTEERHEYSPDHLWYAKDYADPARFHIYPLRQNPAHNPPGWSTVSIELFHPPDEIQDVVMERLFIAMDRHWPAILAR